MITIALLVLFFLPWQRLPENVRLLRAMLEKEKYR